MLTEEELAAMEARCAAATPGPWTAEWRHGFGVGLHPAAAHIQSPSGAVVSDGNYGEGGYVWGEANSAFIAAARTDLPLVLAEVRQLREVRDAARALLAITAPGSSINWPGIREEAVAALRQAVEAASAAEQPPPPGPAVE